VPKKAIKWLIMKHGPLIVRPIPIRYMWRWMLQMLRNCTQRRYAINKAAWSASPNTAAMC
jgi:D-amino-acid dehydrogenase